MKTLHRKAWAAGLLCAACAPAMAEDDAAREDALRSAFYLAPSVLLTQPDELRGLDDAAGYELALGYRGDFTSLELRAEGTRLARQDGGGRAELGGVGIAALVHPLLSVPVLRNLHLGLGFGLHGRKNHPRFTENDRTTYIDAGLGYQLPLTQNLALRLEGRYRLDTQQQPLEPGQPRKFEDTLYSLGLYLPLGRKAPPPPPEPVAVVPVAAADDDGDGVSNPQDLCPNTAAGMSVDASGCEVAPAPIVLSGVNFETASDRLTAQAKTILDGVAQSLLAQPDKNYEVGGHTDDVGDEASNQSLSQRRAEAVRNYLVAQGVVADRLTAAGYGESQPVDSNENGEGRARNRRVELKALDASPPQPAAQASAAETVAEPPPASAEAP